MASITIGNKLIPINSENIITESKYIKNSSYSDTQKPYINTSKTLDDALNNLATHNQSFFHQIKNPGSQLVRCNKIQKIKQKPIKKLALIFA
jgi:hypothetical protein